MKKIVLFLLVLLLSLFAACSAPVSTEPSNQESFLGMISRIQGDSVQVVPFEGEAVRASSDLFFFSAQNLPDISATVGDGVKIVFTGTIRESYPAGIDVTDWSLIQDEEIFPNAPPMLVLSYGENSIPLRPVPPIEWSVIDENSGEISTSTACGLSPLESASELSSVLNHQENVPLLLAGPRMPDSISAVAWPASLLPLTPDEAEAQLPLGTPLQTDGNQIVLPDDGQGYLVEISATWENTEEGLPSYGTAHYVFLIE